MNALSIYAYDFFFVLFEQVAKLREHLEPLRAGTPLVSTAELNALDVEWTQWRSEWVKRRKVFYKCARLVLSPLSRLLQKRPRVPTDVIFILYEWKKFLGTRFRPFVPT